MDPVIQYYDQLAPSYDENRFKHSYGQFIDVQERYFLDSLIQGQDKKILELACGTGRLSHYAQTGVDASLPMIREAQKKHSGKNFLVANARELPFQDASQDIIYAFHFFMHLERPAIESILAECSRILKPAGRLIFDIPSLRRRQLLNYRATSWHGASSFSIKDFHALQKHQLKLLSLHGLLFLPIHHFPAKSRKYLLTLDRCLANSFCKSFSSYLIASFEKECAPSN